VSALRRQAGSDADTVAVRPTFESFAERVWQPLRQALVGALGVDRGVEAHARALSYAWEHQERVMRMDAPVAYLFKVGRSQTRIRRKPVPEMFPLPSAPEFEYEPSLVPALARLPEQQRVAVFLVVGCGWRYVEVAELTGRTESTVRASVQRGLERLRHDLNVEDE
jgi:DNA-directed RNA polymerase specialized sigma24 family protein